MAVILITGAGRGIGLALASAYAARGDQVYAGLRDLESCPPPLSHKNIHPLKFDVILEEDIVSASEQMKKSFGLPDVVINNAGINLPGTVEECPPETWRHIFAVNFFAPMRISQHFLPAMRHAGHGTIVMISSLSAEAGLPYDGPYAASKAALNRAAEALSFEVAPFGIRLLVLEPGAVETGLNRAACATPETTSPYQQLHDHMRHKAGNKTVGALPQDVAAEMIALIDKPDSPLVCPIGEQARDIRKKLQDATAKERTDLIRRASGQ